MIREYKITPASKKKYFYKIVLDSLSACIILLIGMYYYEKIDDLQTVIMTSSATLLWCSIFYVLPVSILYHNHYKHSKGAVFKYNKSEGIFTYSKLSEQYTFRIEDVTLVELCLTNTVLEKRIDWLSIGKYYYTSIYTKQNQKIIVSCIVCDKTATLFPEDLIVRKGRHLPLIPKAKPTLESIDAELETIKKREQAPIHPNERVAKLITKFEKKSQSELQYIINNKNKFQKEAVIAAEYLLK